MVLYHHSTHIPPPPTTHTHHSPQEQIVLRAIRDANVPKFLQDDLKLFNGIVSDLFPTTEDVVVDYGDMEKSIRGTAMEKGLEDVEGESMIRLGSPDRSSSWEGGVWEQD